MFYTAELKIRGERRAGELLAEMEMNVGAKGNAGGQGAKLVRSHGASTQKTLKDIGINQHDVRSYRATAPNNLKDISLKKLILPLVTVMAKRGPIVRLR